MKRAWIVLYAWWLLLYFDCLMTFWDFETVYARVRQSRQTRTTLSAGKGAELSHAVDLACVFYFKQVLCLQRSAALTLLLRGFGYPAELVIGVQLFPFQSHAWVEVSSTVMNDKPYVIGLFHVLERC